jgi:D-alanine-D-alanine ligase
VLPCRATDALESFGEKPVSRSRARVAILYDVWEDTAEEPGPPPPPETSRPKSKPGARSRRKVKRPKLDREEIFDALTRLENEPFYHVLDGHDASLLALSRVNADLVFNLTESYAGDDTKDMNIAAYLELLDKPYTGSGPHALHLAQDKALAKKIFQFHAIRTPFFAISFRGKIGHAHDIEFPLIVKPSSEDGSIGIDVGSVVDSVKELMERIHYIQETFNCPALIEEYIEGREIYAAILGNEKPEALPLVELDLSRLPEGMPRIAGTEVKWERDTEAYKKTKPAIAADLDEKTASALKETAIASYQALKLRDYGRIDMRLARNGKIYVIEANPNPWLSSGAEFALAARESGRSYVDLVREISELALARYAG